MLMSTTSTSIKLPSALKARVAELSQCEGKTVHAWLVEAVAQQVARAEMRESFISDAQAAADAIGWTMTLAASLPSAPAAPVFS